MPKSRQMKQEEAMARKSGRDALTIDQKIAMIKKRPGNNARELERLQQLKETKNAR